MLFSLHFSTWMSASTKPHNKHLIMPTESSKLPEKFLPPRRNLIDPRRFHSLFVSVSPSLSLSHPLWWIFFALFYLLKSAAPPKLTRLSFFLVGCCCCCCSSCCLAAQRPTNGRRKGRGRGVFERGASWLLLLLFCACVRPLHIIPVYSSLAHTQTFFLLFSSLLKTQKSGTVRNNSTALPSSPFKTADERKGGYFENILFGIYIYREREIVTILIYSPSFLCTTMFVTIASPQSVKTALFVR